MGSLVQGGERGGGDLYMCCVTHFLSCVLLFAFFCKRRAGYK